MPTDGPFALVHGQGPVDGRNGMCSLGWWTAGQLVVDPRGGTAINVEGGDFATVGDTMPVQWWPKFTARRVGNEVEVLDPDRKVVATTGRRYRMESAVPFDTRGPIVVCGGDTTPLPTAADLADAYLAAELKVNEANERALAAYNKSSKDLAAGKELHSAFAETEQAFIDEFAAMTMLGDSAPVASQLLMCHDALYELHKSAGWAKTVLESDRLMAQAEDKTLECSGIANELRIALGLPQVPPAGASDSP